MKPIRRQCCDSLFDGRHGWQIEYGKEVLFMRGGAQAYRRALSAYTAELGMRFDRKHAML